jgi:hypothetical protein
MKNMIPTVDARLREENELLRERLLQLEASLGLDEALPPEWGLTRAESVIVKLLLRRREVSHETLRLVLYGDRLEDSPDSRTIITFISKIRQKLRPHGYEIKNIHNFGYRLLTDRPKARQPVPPLIALLEQLKGVQESLSRQIDLFERNIHALNSKGFTNHTGEATAVGDS